MSGFDNDVLFADNWDFRGAVPVVAQATSAGDLPIGTGGSPAIKVGQIVSGDGSVTVSYDDPNIDIRAQASTTFTSDSGSAAATGGILDIEGGTNIATSASGNTVTINSEVEFLNTYPVLSLNQGLEFFTHCFEDPTVCLTTNLSNAELNNMNGLSGTKTTHPGQWRMRLNNNAAARAVFQQSGASATRNIEFGGGVWLTEALVNVGTLSTAADEYIITIGYVSGRNNDAITDGIYWEYDRTNSVNWIGVTESSSTRTEVDSGTAVSTGASAWVKLGILVNAAGTNVDFYLDGTLVGSSTTNITSTALQFFIRAEKSASTGTQDVLYIDYIYIRNTLTTEI